MSFIDLVDNPPEDFEEYLESSGAALLLRELLSQLAQEKPTDILAFLTSFTEAREAREESKMDEDDSNVGEDMNDEIPDFVRHRKRRGAVSSEPNGEVQSITMVAESKPKDASANQKLNDALSRHILCSHLDDAERKEVFDHMSEVNFAPGDFVIRQGTRSEVPIFK